MLIEENFCERVQQECRSSCFGSNDQKNHTNSVMSPTSPLSVSPVEKPFVGAPSQPGLASMNEKHDWPSEHLFV